MKENRSKSQRILEKTKLILKVLKKGFGKSQEIVEFYNVAKIEIEGEFLKRSDINYSIKRKEHL